MTPTIDGGVLFCRQDHETGQVRVNSKLNLVKVDKEGALQWSKIYDNPEGLDPVVHKVIQNPDGSYVITGRYQMGTLDVFLTKFDSFGNLVWSNRDYAESNIANRVNFAKTQDGSYLQAFDNGSSLRLPPNWEPNFGISIRKTDDSGNLVWRKLLSSPHPNSILKVVSDPNNTLRIITNADIFTIDDQGNFISRISILTPFQLILNDVILTPDGGYLFTSIDESDMIAFKNDANGVLLWNKSYPLGGNAQYAYGLNAIDGGFLLTTNQGTDATVIKTDVLGNAMWTHSFSGIVNDLTLTTDSSYVISGFTDAITKTAYLYNLNGKGTVYDNYITGNIFRDGNLNCTLDQNEPGINDWLLEAKGVFSFYYYPDSSGYYDIQLDTGTYDLRVIPIGQFWQSCTGTKTIQVNQNDTVSTDFPMIPHIDCPYLTINGALPRLLRCFPNIYAVHYCNHGTLVSSNTIVELTIHPDLVVNSSTIPWSSQVGNTFTFPIGNLEINECDSFSVSVTPNCNTTQLGQTLCISATIVSDSVCTTSNPNWDESITDLGVNCGQDSLTFIIRNIGAGNMSAPLEYIVIEDNLISKQAPFQLASLDSLAIKLPANGSTYRLRSGQSPGYFPADYTPTLAYEGCGVNSQGSFSMGFIKMFPENDILNTEDVTCTEVRGSYDPNDKQTAPEGYGYPHFIEAGDDLEYQIRFQNTGTDTAFTVVIRDTISPHLDMASLLLGVSSHSYDLEIHNGNMLKFIFNNILLVDSFTNEPLSHGFLKFKISQRDSLPPGTLIYNDAAIYFDFNEPIITNETYHEIEEDFIPTDPTFVDVSLFLEGAYDQLTQLHRTELINKGLLPSNQPYHSPPWNYSGTEGSGWTTVDYPTGTVDWVLVSLRETLSPDSEVAKGAAVLLEDGSLHSFDLVIPANIDSAYVAVYHRNHLPVLSPQRVGITNQQLSFDFRFSDSYSTGTGFGQKQLGGNWGLFAGNGAFSVVGNDVNANDAALWKNDNGYFNKYLISDYNFDGDVNGIDKILWNLNNGVFTGVK